jgi:hypothetical protein
MSVYFNETTGCYIPEGCLLHSRRRDNLKSHSQSDNVVSQRIMYFTLYAPQYGICLAMKYMQCVLFYWRLNNILLAREQNKYKFNVTS